MSHHVTYWKLSHGHPLALSIQPKLLKIWKQQQMVQKFSRKENPESVEFPKCEPFDRKFKKFREQS